jgi:ABC-type antimicrobial peptide transport system permease subunit
MGMWRDVRGDSLEIVGWVRDAKYNSMRDTDVRVIYLPFAQEEEHLWDMCLTIRTSADPHSVAALARAELLKIDPNLTILSIQNVEQQMDKSLVQERMIASLAGFFGVVALLLAAIGLYGVLSYSVARRTSEIGIRLSLGSTRGRVLSLVLRETLWMVVAGIAIGVPVTLLLARLVSSQLYGVSSGDPLTLAIAALLMLAVAVLSGLIPARRAARVDPMIALRYE